MHPLSFAAWCRKDGAHRTSKVAYRDWNEELSEAVKKTASGYWDQFESSATELADVFVLELCGLLDRIRRDLDSMLSHGPYLEVSNRTQRLRGHRSWK